MECSKIREKLPAYVEDDITAEEASLVDEHLRTCHECSESLTDLRKTLQHLKDLEKIEPPQWLTQKIMTRVKDEVKPRKGLFQRLFYPLHVKLPIEAAATVLIAVAAFYIFKTFQPEMKLETHVKLAEAPPEKVEPYAPAETRDKGNVMPQSAPSQKEVKKESKIETQWRESTVSRDKVVKPSHEIRTNPLLEKKGEVASPEMMRASPERKEPSFKKEEAPAFAEGKPSPAKPMSPETFSGARTGAGKIAGESKAPGAGEKRGIAVMRSAVGEDKSKTIFMSDSGEGWTGIGKETKSVTLIWTAKYIENAENIAAENIRLLGGRIIRVEISDGNRILVAELNHEKLGELIEKLSLIGEVKESKPTLEGLGENVVVRIEITGRAK